MAILAFNRYELAKAGEKMDLTEKKLTALEGLVNELLKPQPKEEKVQSFLKDVGIQDPGDPVARIQIVLDALRFEEKDKAFNE
jgi:hypothetical protein